MWMLVSCACKCEFHKYDITHVCVVPRCEIFECVCERDTWKGTAAHCNRYEGGEGRVVCTCAWE